MPKNAAEELGYPAWVLPFAGLVIFVMGAVVIYAAMAFIRLEVDYREWHSLNRVSYLIVLFFWGRFVLNNAAEIENDDGDEEEQ